MRFIYPSRVARFMTGVRKQGQHSVLSTSPQPATTTSDVSPPPVDKHIIAYIKTNSIHETVYFYKTLLGVEPWCDYDYAEFRTKQGVIALVTPAKATESMLKTHSSSKVIHLPVNGVTGNSLRLLPYRPLIRRLNSGALYLNDPDGNQILIYEAPSRSLTS